MSNQEAIALLRNLEDSLDSYCELSEEGKTAFRMAIEALSSSEFPNSSDTDTISRQAAIDLIDCIETERLKGNIELIYAPAIKGLIALPTAEPERIKSKWALHTYMPHNKFCLACRNDSPYNKRWDFCPNCGAKMEVTE